MSFIKFLDIIVIFAWFGQAISEVEKDYELVEVIRGYSLFTAIGNFLFKSRQQV